MVRTPYQGNFYRNAILDQIKHLTGAYLKFSSAQGKLSLKIEHVSAFAIVFSPFPPQILNADWQGNFFGNSFEQKTAMCTGTEYSLFPSTLLESL